MAHSKVSDIEQALHKGGDHFRCAFCQPKPQCNGQTTVFASFGNPHHSSEAHTTIPLQPLFSCICTTVMRQPPDHSSVTEAYFI